MKYENFFIIAGLLISLVSCEGSEPMLVKSAPSAAPNKIFDSLLEKSAQFADLVPFPTQDNLIKNIAVSDKIKDNIAEQAQNTYALMHSSLHKLIADFLSYKKNHGSVLEKEFYKNMSESAFIDRLMSKRPLAFLTSSDSYLLRDGTRGAGGFEAIGTKSEVAPLLLKDYISYDEMQISALLSVSTPTYFINDGARDNRGVPQALGTFESQGVYIAQVGARFEKPGLMEWAHIIVTPSQNTEAQGYGAHKTAHNFLLKIWEDFYGLKCASFDEAKKDNSGRFVKISDDEYFDKVIYKKRMAVIIEPFLLDAHQRARAANTRAYVHAVGLGLGVWQKTENQGQWLVEVYADILKKYNFSAIADINFSYFPSNVSSCGGVSNQNIFSYGGNNIIIHFSKRNPAALLSGKDQGKLLVASYAWDANSYPGNEYWMHSLTASGDPAAASCSSIPEMQNPAINTYLRGDKTLFLSTQDS